MKTEPELTRDLCRALRRRGALVRNIVYHRMSEPGWPDRWLGHPFWHGHLEFKAWGGRLEPLQRKILGSLHALNEYTALVVRHGAVHDPGDGLGARMMWSQVELHDGTVLAHFDQTVERGAVGLLLALDAIRSSKVVYGAARLEQDAPIREALRRVGGGRCASLFCWNQEA